MIKLNYTYRPSPHRAVNTLHLGCKSNQLKLYREIIAVCSDIHIEHTNNLRGKNVLICLVTTGHKGLATT